MMGCRALNDCCQLEGKQVPGAIASLSTLFCGNVIDNQVGRYFDKFPLSRVQWVQVTDTSVRLISVGSLDLVDEWLPPSGKPISVTACTDDAMLVASGADLFHLSITSGHLVLVAFARFLDSADN